MANEKAKIRQWGGPAGPSRGAGGAVAIPPAVLRARFAWAIYGEKRRV